MCTRSGFPKATAQMEERLADFITGNAPEDVPAHTVRESVLRHAESVLAWVTVSSASFIIQVDRACFV
ncbi:unnamed protein product [Ranitomeya imitator]|uniref:Uncharacterized protein n=1 Tax=Ranitomeya imitator TaxID=111125 RepID=A0ABN9LJ11_9NEOB|nr:unnamed protein product [Ranitomeya imitator]